MNQFSGVDVTKFYYEIINTVRSRSPQAESIHPSLQQNSTTNLSSSWSKVRPLRNVHKHFKLIWTICTLPK